MIAAPKEVTRGNARGIEEPAGPGNADAQAQPFVLLQVTVVLRA